MTEIEQPQRFPEWEKASDFHEIYTNYLHANWTLFDVRLRFGQLVPRDSGNPVGGLFVEERGAVTLSWGQAKHLRDVLVGLIEKYEEVNGVLQPPTLPPSV